MVNVELKWRGPIATISAGSIATVRFERIFATKSALTQLVGRPGETQEVVLVQPIHRLLRTMGGSSCRDGLRDSSNLRLRLGVCRVATGKRETWSDRPWSERPWS